MRAARPAPPRSQRTPGRLREISFRWIPPSSSAPPPGARRKSAATAQVWPACSERAPHCVAESRRPRSRPRRACRDGRARHEAHGGVAPAASALGGGAAAAALAPRVHCRADCRDSLRSSGNCAAVCVSGRLPAHRVRARQDDRRWRRLKHRPADPVRPIHPQPAPAPANCTSRSARLSLLPLLRRNLGAPKCRLGNCPVHLTGLNLNQLLGDAPLSSALCYYGPSVACAPIFQAPTPAPPRRDLPPCRPCDPRFPAPCAGVVRRTRVRRES